MNKEQQRLFLKMKELIRQGKRRFLERKDRNYTKDLKELGLEEDEAWNIVLKLKQKAFSPSESFNAMVFYWIVNNIKVYIKLEIVYENEEEVVCWSFHKNRR